MVLPPTGPSRVKSRSDVDYLVEVFTAVIASAPAPDHRELGATTVADPDATTVPAPGATLDAGGPAQLVDQLDAPATTDGAVLLAAIA